MDLMDKNILKTEEILDDKLSPGDQEFIRFVQHLIQALCFGQPESLIVGVSFFICIYILLFFYLHISR